MDHGEVRFVNPYTRITLRFPVSKVREAVRFVLEVVGIPDLDDALFNCWQIAGTLSDREKELLSLAQTIVSGTKDGYVKPEEFDVYKVAEEIALEIGLL